MPPTGSPARRAAPPIEQCLKDGTVTRADSSWSRVYPMKPGVNLHFCTPPKTGPYLRACTHLEVQAWVRVGMRIRRRPPYTPIARAGYSQWRKLLLLHLTGHWDLQEQPWMQSGLTKAGYGRDKWLPCWSPTQNLCGADVTQHILIVRNPYERMLSGE